MAQAVFLAYMVVLKRKANVGVSAVLLILTVLVKMRYVLASDYFEVAHMPLCL